MSPMFSRLSLQWKLPLLVAAVLVAVAGAILFAASREVRDAAERAVSQRLVTVSSQLAQSLVASARAEERTMRRFAERPAVATAIEGPPAERARALVALDSLFGGDSTLIALTLYDSTGAVAAARGPQAARVASFTVPAWRDGVLGADSARQGVIQAFGDSGLVYPTIAVVARDGHVLGAVARWRRILSNPNARRTIATLLGQDAMVALGTRGGAWTDQGARIAAPDVALDPADATVRRGRGPDGPFLAAVAGDPATGWLAVVEFPDSAVFGPARQFELRMMLLTALIGAVGLVFAWLMSRRITTPLVQLTSAADHLATREMPVHHLATTSEDELGRLAHAFNQMADQVQGEVAARAASEEQWRLLFRNHPHPMWVFDIETLRFLAVNDAMAIQYGWSKDELLTMSLVDLRPPEDVPEMVERVRENRNRRLSAGVFIHKRRDGSKFEVEVTANPVIFDGREARLVLGQDVSERRALEQQLRQAQKMEAVGRLAGGVAHDFNNLLAVIITYTELVHGALAADDPRTPDLEAVLAAATKANALTRQLLTFSRQRAVQPVVLDPNAALHDVERMLHRVIGEDIEFVTKLGDDVGAIRIDPGQFEQAIVNLVVNARDAMPTGGTIRITTAVVDVDEASRQIHGLATAGRFVVLTVVDTGIGMTPETRSRIFEPFFTTKEVGKGTGLGLATVYAVMQQAGGGVSVYSEPGLGTTFRLYFPQEAAGAVPQAVATPGAAPQGAETILLVEDDAAVRSAAAEALARLGYTVLPAQGVDDATMLIERHAQPIHLVISDVVMPKLDGPTLVAQLQAKRPALKALLMSGYTGDAIASRGVNGSRLPLLEKPFTVLALAQAVRRVLDG